MSVKGFQFSEEQIKYIIDNWGKETVFSMKKKFGCSWNAVAKVAEKNGLELPKKNEWSNEEVEQLKALSEELHYLEIAEIMGKTPNAIRLKASRLGITLIQNRRKWTEDEEETLRELWGNKPVDQIARKLKRTVLSLRIKALRMNLGPMIDNNSELITLSELEELLNAKRDRVMSTWVELGLKVRRKRIGKVRYYYGITWNDLMDFLEKNQNEWDSRFLEKNALGPEPNWLKEKRKRDKLENPLWYRKWTEKEIEKAEELFKSGKSYQEIAKEINRTEGAVKYLLRNMGYAYRQPRYWKGQEIKYLRENYQDMTYEEIGKALGRTTKGVASKAEEMGYQKILRKQNCKEEEYE